MSNANAPSIPNAPINMITDSGTGEQKHYTYDWIELGLTKREHFAGLAMQGLVSRNSRYGGDTTNRNNLARDAIAHADALLAELESI